MGSNTSTPPIEAFKPFLRGWFHAAAAVAAGIFTIVLCWRSWSDQPRLLSLAIYGFSMIELYTVSATYHIGSWRQPLRGRLRALDHANIFILIAGTYTPLCYNLLSGWLRPTILITIWLLAAAGIGLTVTTLRTPRWLRASLYVVMGWVALLVLPDFLAVVPWTALVPLFLGGLLYTLGAVIYARRWPDPFPRVLGFHEIFHLFVIAGSIVFAAAIWMWALTFHRI